MTTRILHALSIIALISVTACTMPQPRDKVENRVTTTPPSTSSKMARLAGDVANPAGLRTTPSGAAVPMVKVALLLPLTGESKALGQSMLDAATLALYDAYVSLPPDKITARVTLIPKDTQSSPALAAEAAKEVIAQGASLIIGPLFSSSVSAVAPIARAAGVPVLSLSNNKAVAQPGVYVLGFLPEQQVKRVSEYAALHNITAIGALVPNDAYGKTVSDTLSNTLTPQGVRIEPVESYSQTQANLEAAITRIKAGYSRAPFQGLMLAESGPLLRDMLTALKSNGLSGKSVRFLGTGLWDDEEILANPDLRGGWLASAPPQDYASFSRRFVASYAYKPKRLAGLAYDAVALAAKIALASGGPDYSDLTLTAPDGFIGPADGLYRLRLDGTSERALAVMEITEGGFRQLDPAPLAFDKK